MTSQLVIFRAFLFIFFVPPTLGLKKNPLNQLIKKIWPKYLPINGTLGKHVDPDE